MVLVVLDRRVFDLDAETGEQLVQVVPVLVLLGLGTDDEPAAAADEGVDRVELRAGEDRRAAVDGGLPLRVGGMGDDEDIDVEQELGVEWALDVRRDLEIALGERRCRPGIRGVAGVAGLNRGGNVGADRPRLRVRLVEDDAGNLFAGDRHLCRVVAALDGVNGSIRADMRNYLPYGRA